MDTSFNSKTPNFGLLDFFLYLAPGTIVLISIILFAGISPGEFINNSDITASIVTIIVAYFLGHAIYPLSYPLRTCCHKKIAKRQEAGIKKSRDQNEKDFFNEDYLDTLIAHPDFCLSQLIRYRSLSRFTIAMIVPCILIGLGTATYFLCHLRELSVTLKIVLASAAIIFGGITSYGFGYRYCMYWRRLILFMEKCKNCPKHQTTKQKRWIRIF